MRRAMTTLFAATVTAVLLVGCAGSGGLDGDLTDDWAAMAAPSAFTPAAGVCHAADFTDVVTLAGYDPVDCAGPHRLETVHVGAFPAERATAPAGGSPELRGAFAECDTRASGYVGDDWRAGRLRLSVALPSGPGWVAGARWYRCDLTELTTVEAAATVVVRSGSLRDALKGASTLRLGCQQTRGGAGRGAQTLVPVECGKQHDAEFVGVWRAPDTPYPTRDADWVPLYAGCRGVLGRYVGVPNDAELRFRSGVVVRPPGAGRWRVGDRGVRCYLWLSNRTVTASLKGAGPAGLPVRTK
ncbi:septum formation family protein [Micromonospora sp. STR1_7]|uniref:Septum formation family protein n=1 Tax=Micromonospora parastrephiae TaxID=2806101 RepID=A0ABS1XZ59_9ACTN|nr:septum formation family protein [Micromonospora parastrephiae]MBM0234544.1 septum formation family protein [Micromonospora parastrephiae]